MSVLFVCAVQLWAGHAGHAAEASAKVALVIGNSNYATLAAVGGKGRADERPESRSLANLPNARKDAVRIARALTDRGFSVQLETDLNEEELATVLREFSSRAQSLPDASTVVVYYAGHGIQIEEMQYLAPVGVTVLTDENPFYARRAEFARGLVPLSHLKLSPRKQGLNLILLDACRQNPWPSLAGRGEVNERLSPQERRSENPSEWGVPYMATVGSGYPSAPSGTVVALAAAPGRFALDGVGDNSPFAEALVEQLAAFPADVPQLLASIRQHVIATTKGYQVPHYYPSTPNLLISDSDGAAPYRFPPTGEDFHVVAEEAQASSQRSLKIAEDALSAAAEAKRQLEIQQEVMQDEWLRRSAQYAHAVVWEGNYEDAAITHVAGKGVSAGSMEAGVVELKCAVVFIRARCPLPVIETFAGDTKTHRGVRSLHKHGIVEWGEFAPFPSIYFESKFTLQGPRLKLGRRSFPNGDLQEGSFSVQGDLKEGYLWTQSGFCYREVSGGVASSGPICQPGFPLHEYACDVSFGSTEATGGSRAAVKVTRSECRSGGS